MTDQPTATQRTQSARQNGGAKSDCKSTVFSGGCIISKQIGGTRGSVNEQPTCIMIIVITNDNGLSIFGNGHGGDNNWVAIVDVVVTSGL
jgi:hypothetical protein